MKFRLVLGVLGIFILILLVSTGNSETNEPNNFIGESGMGWEIDIIEDDRQEVVVHGFEYNESIVEIILDEHPNSTTGNGYKWKMALCNSTGSGLKYMNEDAQGGFDNAVWLDVNYGLLTNFGLNETWCPNENNYGYILFTAGSKNDFPKTIRLLPNNISNYTLYSGTGSAVLVATSAISALNGGGENICRGKNGELFVAYEGLDDDLFFANSSFDNGLTWSSKEIFGGTVQHIAIICGDENNVTVFFARGGGDIDYFSSDDLGETFNGPFTAMEQAFTAFTRTSCARDSNETVYCLGYDAVNDIYQITNSSIFPLPRGLASQGSSNDTDHVDVEVDLPGNVYVLGAGNFNHDLSIWSSNDGFTTRNAVNLTLPITTQSATLGVFGIDISLDGNIYFGGPRRFELFYCNGTTADWNGGEPAWNCQKTATGQSRATDIAVTLNNDIQMVAQNNSDLNNSYVLRTNSSNLGETWDARQFLNNRSAVQPTIASSMFPLSNRVNGTVRYVFANDTGVFYDSYAVEPPNTCIYQGNEWDIKLEDNCVIGDFQNISGNGVNLRGASGSLTINSTGRLLANAFRFLPSDFNGGSIFKIDIGGILHVQ